MMVSTSPEPSVFTVSCFISRATSSGVRPPRSLLPYAPAPPAPSTIFTADAASLSTA